MNLRSSLCKSDVITPRPRTLPTAEVHGLNNSVVRLGSSRTPVRKFMLSKEVTRLRDKDVRQRRKAVRRLFEDGDPSALPHFLPFLNDQDDWFVERAMIAIERWYDGRDEGSSSHWQKVRSQTGACSLLGWRIGSDRQREFSAFSRKTTTSKSG